MPKINVCSELTALNIRLAVRQAVADFCANPEETVESIVNAEFENLVEPVQRLVAARLEHIYEQLKYSILSPSNEPPPFGSVLRFLSEHIDESEKHIVQRFEKDSILSQGHMHKKWQKFKTPPPIPTNPSSPVVDIPRLEDLTSGHSRDSTSDKHQKSTREVQNSNFFSFPKNASTISTMSSNFSSSSGNSLLQPIHEIESNRQELDLSESKANSISSCNLTERSFQHTRSSRKIYTNGEILSEIPVVLEQEFVPTVPSIDEATIHPTSANEKSKVPVSLNSSLRSDDDKMTVRYIPKKVPAIDAAVSTDPVFMTNQSIGKIEVGVNTIIEMGTYMTDGSSSSNTASDNSVGQLPKRLFDTILQKPSLRIVSLRPDGSVVPKDDSVSRHFPSVREWTGNIGEVTSEENTEKSVLDSKAEACDITSKSDLSHSGHNEKEGLDSVSASASQPDPFEDDLNTLANISPLPHS